MRILHYGRQLFPVPRYTSLIYLTDDSVTGVSRVDRVNLGSRRPRQNSNALFPRKTNKHCTSPLGFNQKFLVIFQKRVRGFQQV